ncbi:MAG TPA: MFS transporter [Rariglobus sp.]
MSAPAPLAPPPASDTGNTTPKRWTCGTLTYTSGGLVVLFLWLLWGDFAWSMRDRSVGPMAQWYLNHLNVPNLLFGLLISSFPAAIGLVLGPIISVKSDRHRGKWGRRIPFLLVTTPIAALGMIGIGLTPLLAKWVHGFFPGQSEVFVAVLCFGIFWAAFEFASIAGQAVFGGLINDIVPRPLLGRFYGLFRAVSLIDGMIFNFWVMGKVPEHFTLILVVIGVFYGTAFFWVCLKVKEGAYPPPPATTPAKSPGAPGIAHGFYAGVRTYFRECFSQPYYLAVFVLVMSAGLTFGPVNTFSIPYARSLEIDMRIYGRALALTFFISLGLSFFLGWLADVFHPLRMAMSTLLGYALVTAWGAIYANDANSFLIAWVMHGVLSGCYFTSAASLGQRLFPRSRYAQFASAAGILTSLANMVLAPVMGSFIDLTGGIYRHTFTAGCCLALLALGTAWHVHGKFMRLGGPKNYTAPE